MSGYFMTPDGTVLRGQPNLSRGSRPVVVLDPGDRVQLERLADHPALRGNPLKREPLINALSQAIDSLLPIVEPREMWAVVQDDAELNYLRVNRADDRPWQCADTGEHFNWEDVDAVRVLSEGVQP